MSNEAETFYQAVLARDRRFDGRFFTAVRTTKIYCRPICPARPPLLRNVHFYPTAAAAEEAGFRPCLRCRPETAPGTPAWIGTSATVARALRLLRGGLDEDGLPALAGRLGISDRRLRQLFAEHLGASPQSILRVQRLDFARRLIDETTLPFTEVAASAGFRSIRRFNDAVKARFGKPPSDLRKRPKNRQDDSESATKEGQGELILKLPYRPPLAWFELLQFLAARAIAGIEMISAGSYRRTVTIGNSEGFIEVRPAKSEGSLELHLHLPQSAAISSCLLEAVERVRTMFDLEADPLRIAAHLEKDPRLQAVVAAHPGLRVPGGFDGFELAMRAVLGQQVSVKGASTLCARLVQRFGKPLDIGDAPPGLTHVFPAPELLAQRDLTRIGIPKSRALALQELAKRVADGRIVLDGCADLAETERQLLDVPGIGPWTAQYIAMRVLRDPDAIPATDLVLKRCLGSGNADDLRPWRAYAAMYLWQTTASTHAQTEKTS